MNFRTIGKFGLLLVVIGFFMPVACDMNGFQLASEMNGDDAISAIFLYALFVSALVGCIIGVLLLMKKNVKISIDWICILVCIGSGLFVYFKELNDLDDLQRGAYFILIGWVIAFIAQIISTVKRER